MNIEPVVFIPKMKTSTTVNSVSLIKRYQVEPSFSIQSGNIIFLGFEGQTVVKYYKCVKGNWTISGYDNVISFCSLITPSNEYVSISSFSFYCEEPSLFVLCDMDNYSSDIENEIKKNIQGDYDFCLLYNKDGVGFALDAKDELYTVKLAFNDKDELARFDVIPSTVKCKIEGKRMFNSK